MCCHGRRTRSRFAAAHATVPGALLGTVLAAVLTGRGPHHLGTGVTSAAHASPHVRLSAEFTAPPTGAEPVATVPPLTSELSRPDLLVISTEPLSAALRERITTLRGITATLPLSVASVRVAGRSITVAAAEPGGYRRFTPKSTAVMTGVWRAVAAGEVALSHRIAADLKQPLGGTLDIGQLAAGLPLRIGALATTVPQINAVVNEQRRAQLGMPRDNALLVSLRNNDLVALAETIKHVVARRAHVQLLRRSAVAAVTQVAWLTGGAVADAVGTFRYRSFPDGNSTTAAKVGGSEHPQRDGAHPRQRYLSQRDVAAATCGIDRDFTTWARRRDRPERLRRLLCPAIHRPRPQQRLVPAHLGHRDRPQCLDQSTRDSRRDRSRRRSHLQEVGLRLGRRLGMD